MCGRFALTATEDELIKHFSLVQGFNMVPRYNIAPSQWIPVIKDLPSHLGFAQWGFIPAWAKSTPDKKPMAHINARSETVQSKPTFKQAFKKRRCLVPASGYYEWKTVKGKKQPYYISVPSQPILAFMALWEIWSDDDNDRLETCTLITAQANDQLSRVHERMPLICLPEHYAAWLNTKTKSDQLDSLLQPTSLDYSIYPVSTKVNSPKFDEASCLKSLSE